MNEIYKPIESLNKIGKARAEKYHKLGINTIYDLLYISQEIMLISENIFLFQMQNRGNTVFSN